MVFKEGPCVGPSELRFVGQPSCSTPEEKQGGTIEAFNGQVGDGRGSNFTINQIQQGSRASRVSRRFVQSVFYKVYIYIHINTYSQSKR